MVILPEGILLFYYFDYHGLFFHIKLRIFARKIYIYFNVPVHFTDTPIPARISYIPICIK